MEAILKKYKKGESSLEHSIYHVYPKADPNGFEFTTVAGVTYACYFILAESIFDDYLDVAKAFTPLI